MTARRLTRIAAAAALMLSVTACTDGVTSPRIAPVATLTIAPSIMELSVGDTIKLAATALDGNQRVITGRRITWKSSDAFIASVDTAGTVVARNGGEVRITAAIEGREAQRDFVVAHPPAYLELNPSSAALPVGGSRQLIALVKASNGATLPGIEVTFSSSHPNVASVEATGIVSANAQGVALIRATAGALAAETQVRVLPVEPDPGFALVYTSYTAPVGGALHPESWMVSVITGFRSRIAWSQGASQVVPSPNGAEYLVVAPNHLGMSRIHKIDADGTGMRVLVEAAAGVHLDQPVWSPDGSRIAYRSYGNIGVAHDIWVANADGSDPRNLTAEMNGEARNPTFSPRLGDGMHRVAFALITQTAPFAMSQIRTVREDGQVHRAITPVSGYLDDEPAWSPDGTTIVFVRSGQDAHGDLWTVTPSGSGARQLVDIDPPGPQRSPSWSPDGQFIAFTSAHEIIGTRAGDYQIYTMDAVGTRIQRRTEDPYDKLTPAWVIRTP
jgi:hypothetical protein